MPESYGFLSTYPPTQCGLATFTDALATHLGDGAEVGIVRVVDRFQPDRRSAVVHQLVTGAAGSEMAAATALNRFDVAVVQHEFGIFAGQDGAAVLEVLRQVRVPTVVVLHTVLVNPSPHQRSILEEVVAIADAVVVMTGTAQRRLLDGYLIDAEKVVLIPHGAPTDWAAVASAGRDASAGSDAGVPIILTWGLLGPGKGIEWAIEAVARLHDLEPAPRYLVAGETHPKVLEHQGSAYRDGLIAEVARLGIGDRVEFDDRYLDQASLRKLVASADVVVLPYDSKDQVTSGVLIEAVTCRRPVVATAFPHAVELLVGGAGIVVPQKDARALARALRRILTEPGLSASMVKAAERLAPDLTWRTVADQYRFLGQRLVDEAVPVVA